ncbi:M28 family peptidase [bacterium]|nr:M28 family peptidase [bacterium]
MKYKFSTSLAAFCFLIFSGSVLAQFDVPVQTDSAMAYLKILTDPDTFQGRKTGIESGNQSQRWIANRFNEWGLKPLFGNDTYVEYEQLVTDEIEASMTIYDTPWGKIEFLLGDDFTLNTNSGSGNIKAPVTFIGYGVNEPEMGWDDYNGVDVEGHVVVIHRGSPPNDEDWSEYMSRSYKLNKAVEHGAVAVLFKDHRAFPIDGAAMNVDAYHEDIPSAYIGERVVNHLLYGTHLMYSEYKKKMKEGPFPLTSPQELRIKARVKRIEPGIGYNVVGVVPGTDKNLKKEAIIIGAHGDHVGPDALGHVWVGADDNGSGTCVIMEMARVFAQNPQPRTLIFCLFGGEEQGLLGSEDLAPKMPDTYEYINMVNMDMAGRGDGVFGLGGADQFPEVWEWWWSELPDSIKDNYEANRAWGGHSSDHAPFKEVGIPAFTTYSKGDHSFYHRMEDRFETIHKAAIGGAVTGASRWVAGIASFPEKMADRHIKARSVWHRGAALAHFNSGDDVAADIKKAKNHLADGYMGSVITLRQQAKNVHDWGLMIYLDKWRDLTENEENVTIAGKLSDLGGNSYKRTSSVFLAMPIDSFASGDTLWWDVIQQNGIHWAVMEDATAWISGSEVREDKKALLEHLNETETVVQIPLATLSDWMPLSEILGEKLVAMGSWTEFSTITDDQIKQFSDNGCNFALTVAMDEVPDVLQNIDSVSDYALHLQPAVYGYEESLKWMESFQGAEVESKLLLKWIGDNLKKW